MIKLLINMGTPKIVAVIMICSAILYGCLMRFIPQDFQALYVFLGLFFVPFYVAIIAILVAIVKLKYS